MVWDGLKTLVGFIWTAVKTYKSFIPMFFVGSYLLFSLLIAGFHSAQAGDWGIFGSKLANIVFASDYNIYTRVMIAVETPEQYNVLDLIEIYANVMTIYYLIKWLSKLQEKFGSHAEFGAHFISMIILGLIEITTVRFVNGVFFFPFYGVFTLLTNLPAVLSNINFNFLSKMAETSEPIVENATNEIVEVTLNSTLPTINTTPTYII